MWLLHPRSRGYVRLASANPFENPLIDPRFLSHQGDVDMFVSGKSVIQLVWWCILESHTSTYRNISNTTPMGDITWVVVGDPQGQLFLPYLLYLLPIAISSCHIFTWFTSIICKPVQSSYISFWMSLRIPHTLSCPFRTLIFTRNWRRGPNVTKL